MYPEEEMKVEKAGRQVLSTGNLIPTDSKARHNKLKYYAADQSRRTGNADPLGA
jgi:hypothetical protein